MFEQLQLNVQSTPFFNATHESFKIQCDSKIFVFKGRSITSIPNDLAEFVFEQVKERGVFPILASDNKNTIKQKEVNALKHFKEAGHLSQRIAYYNSYYDAMKAAGKTVDHSRHFKDALRHDKELALYLNIHDVPQETTSYLTKEQREAAGIVVDAATVKEIDSESETKKLVKTASVASETVLTTQKVNDMIESLS